MDIKVKKLCDIDSVKIPEEFLVTEVDESEVDAALNGMSLRYAKKSEVDACGEGDILFCDGGELYPDGRDVLIFTGTAVPGAQKAAADGVGKRVGESFNTELCGKKASLTVKKIVHLTPAEINDEFIKSLSLEDVGTVSEYKEHIRATIKENLEAQKGNLINHFFMETLINESEFSYDEAQMKAYVEKAYAESVKMYGEEFAEEDPDDMKASIESFTKQSCAVKAFCEEKGLEPDMDAINGDVDSLLQMMALTGEEAPSREELLESEVSGAYMNMFFEYVKERTKA